MSSAAGVVAPRLGSDDVTEYWATWNHTAPAGDSGIMQFFYDLQLLPSGPPTAYYYEAMVGDQARYLLRELVMIGLGQPEGSQPAQVPVLINHFSGEVTGFARPDGTLIVPLFRAD